MGEGRWQCASCRCWFGASVEPVGKVGKRGDKPGAPVCGDCEYGVTGEDYGEPRVEDMRDFGDL